MVRRPPPCPNAPKLAHALERGVEKADGSQNKLPTVLSMPIKASMPSHTCEISANRRPQTPGHRDANLTHDSISNSRKSSPFGLSLNPGSCSARPVRPKVHVNPPGDALRNDPKHCLLKHEPQISPRGALNRPPGRDGVLEKARSRSLR